MLKVGVLLGGKSIEREVSLNSGRTICDHLDTQLFQVIPLFQAPTGDLFILPWSFLYRGKIADFEHRLEREATKIVWDDLPSMIDFMYIAMHGKYAEDGRLQAILELLNIPYLGTKLFGSSVGMNKVLQNHYLKMHGIKTPSGFSVTVDDVRAGDVAIIEQRMQQHGIVFPVVVKPQSEGSSLGVFVAHDLEKLMTALTKSCFVCGPMGQDVMIEEKLIGMEFNCIVITDYVTGEFVALPPTEIMLRPGVEIFDYHHKYMPGAANKRTPPLCSVSDLQKIKDACIATMRALEFVNVGRFDGFLTVAGEVVMLDSNPICGTAPSSFLFRQAAEVGMGHGQIINHLIKTELQQYHMERTIKMEAVVKKTRVAVLLGGPSNEKEISFESGRNVCYKLSPEKYEVIPVFVDSDMKLHQISQQLLVSTSTKEIASRLDQAIALRWSDLKTICDFVFIALHGGPGENGVVQGTLEMLGIPYNGPSIFASSLCMDKYKTGKFLAAQGFHVPIAFLLSKQDFLNNKLDELREFLTSVNFSCIVKPHDDGCSVLVAAPKNEQELMSVLQEIFQQKDFALIEERVVGMELTVGVIGNQNPRVLVPSEVVARGGVLSIEEKFLPGAGENQTPARLNFEDIAFVQKVVRDSYLAVGCIGYSRIDCFFQTALQSPTGQKRVVILEFNTLPGLTPATCLFHQAAEVGMRPMELLDEIIQYGFAAHRSEEIVSVDDVLLQHEQF